MRSEPKSKLTDDLFDRSTMSFGEHLEELRKTLLKAMGWLALGTLVGFYVANHVLLHIKNPIVQALRQSAIQQATTRFEESHGVKPPERLLELMIEEHVFPEVVLVEPCEEQKAVPPIASVDAIQTTVAQRDLSMDPWRFINADSLDKLRPQVNWRKMPTNLKAFSATEPFSIWFKAAVLSGFVIGSPGIFWHLWHFLSAGLYPFERRQVYWYLPLSLLLFLAGTLFAFYFLLQLVLGFLISYSVTLEVDYTLRLNEYVSFALLVPLGFGIAFQLPIVMLGLNRFGIIPLETYIEQWRMAVLAIAFLSMILTPAEFYTMLGMFFPLTGLYFLGIALCKYLPHRA